MKARPILFKPDMVNAILEGRKVQTRRIVKPLAGAGWQPKTANGDPCLLGWITTPHPKKGKFGLFMRREIYSGSGKYEHDLIPCPYGAPGDVLWVREAWGIIDDNTVEAGAAAYRATDPVALDKWRPSIHMPRWASRLTLEITDVRVERLQDISEEDARAEGARLELAEVDSVRLGAEASHRSGFQNLWKSINGEESWAANPWVWVVEFQPHHTNVDAFLRGREVA
ncbi:MAG: hypothetical protein FH747_03045 [Stenotrophomonas sp.]|uniref:hypothetical protein n=1 Tax=Stenotrophomonas sp. TaxID=69392 RepID=UPI001355D351|nr:hypothetical protein [Stenotrophomonas sp.]MTI72564.1 hypothetical protein [Stenotrophomonas sp.]MTI72624.1 hypothetical protein [Stenotrophomonas sp.]